MIADFNGFDILSYAPGITRALAGYLPINEGISGGLVTAMNYGALSAGKRIRGGLCLFGAEAFGGDAVTAMPFACAIEMIHAYSLIHDDLPCMDDDDFRRGQPSCHKKFGEAAAVLAGDALLTQAFLVMAEAALMARDKHPHLRATQLIAACAGTRGMLGGQMADVNPPANVEKRSLLMFIEQNKTAKLMKAALVSGLLLGNAPDNATMAFTMFASRFGAAFQIADDVLDAQNGADEPDKLTSVSVYGLEKAKKMAQRQAAEAIEAVRAFPEARPLVLLAERVVSGM